MKRYDIRVRYSFEGTYTVAAEDRDEAKRMVNDDCGLVLGGDIHTTRDDDEVLDWDFCIHPDTRILSLQERGGKGSLPSEAVDFSGRWKSHSTLTLLATQDLSTFGYNMIDPLKSWCWGSILFYPFKNSRFS